MNNNNRIASVDIEEKFPDRARHRAMFEALLGDSYTTALKTGEPKAFVYAGQTDPAPTSGLLTQFALCHPSELLSVVENMVRTAHAAGHLSDLAVRALSEEIAKIPNERDEE